MSLTMPRNFQEGQKDSFYLYEPGIDMASGAMASIGRGSHIQAPVPKLLHTNTPPTLSERDLVTKKVITVQEEFKKFARLDYVRGLDKREIPSTARPHL